MIRLKEYRKKNGMSQQDIADRLDISGNTVSQWETGDRRPNIDMLIRLTEIFGCTADELLGINRSSRNEEELVSGRSELLGITRGPENKEEGAV